MADHRIGRVAVRRRSHWLVYCPDEMVDREGMNDLIWPLSAAEKSPVTKKWRMVWTAAIDDVDPKKNKVRRLPGNVSEAEIKAAWPTHEIARSMRPWPARLVQVRFREGEFPFRNNDQARATEYLASEGESPGMKLLVADTGLGKSYCAIRAWVQFGDVLLGTFAALPHLENFKTELLKFTDLSEGDILVVEDGRSSLARAVKKGLTPKAILVLHKTVSRCIDEAVVDGRVCGSSNEFTDFALAMGVGTHISDECQLELRSLVFLGMLTNFQRTFYLTATPSRTDWSEKRVLEHQLPMESGLYLKKTPRLKVVQIAYDSRPSEQQQALCIGRQDNFDPVRFFDYMAMDSNFPHFEEMVMALCNRALKEEGATGVAVVVSGRLEFLDALIHALKRRFPDKGIGNFSSRVPVKERMGELKKEIFVTTDKSFNGSVNPPRTSHLILAAPLSSAVTIEQITGRLRGINGIACVVYDIWDSGFPKLTGMASRRRTTFRKLSKELTEENYHFGKRDRD